VDEAREKLEKLQESLTANDRTETAISIHNGPTLKTLRMAAAPVMAENGLSIRAPKRGDGAAANEFMDTHDNEPVLMLTPSNKKTFRRNPLAIVLNGVAVFARLIL
jgi:hypothetical protein